MAEGPEVAVAYVEVNGRPKVVNALLSWFLAGAVPAVDWATTGG